METVHVSYAASTDHAFDIGVELYAGGVRVLGGPVRLFGQDYMLPAEDIEIAAGPHAISVCGYLAIDTADSSMVVFVDEHIQDGIDMPYIFDRGDRYQLCAHLFAFNVPPNATDLSQLDYHRWRITQQAGGTWQ